MTAAGCSPEKRSKPEGRVPLRVLIVEDNEDDALLLLRELKRGGYQPFHERVYTREAMDEALGRGPWEIVVSDYYMPGFRAPDALMLLREKGFDTPFVIVSGKVGEELAVEAMKAGAYDYIMKDNMTRLCAAVERGIEEAEVRREKARAEEKYRSIFENAVDGIFQTSVDGRFLTANPAMARILGYSSSEELIGDISDAASQLYADPAGREEITWRLVREGAVSGFETRFLRKDGGEVWVSISARVLRGEGGELAGYEGTVEDITERKRAEESLRRSLDRLVALHEAGQILGSTLEPEEIGARLLEIMRRISGLSAAAISLREEDGRLEIWRSIGLENPAKQRYAPGAREAMQAAVEKEETSSFALAQPDGSGGGPADGGVGLYLPLRVRERVVGLLEAYGPGTLVEEENVSLLESLTNGAASALENARLYGELQESAKRLQELVGKILVAQEEERRRVAYEVHDGLAQVAAAAHQHLQAFAQLHPPQSEEGREDLARVSKLVRQSVAEARQIIADLRPTALDEFGLKTAVRLHIDALKAEGWEVGYEASLGGERLPAAMETALFRVVQEALNNVGKHAGTNKVDVTIARLPQDPPAPGGGRRAIRLSVRDYGRGFAPGASSDGGPGEKVGLAGMRERITLLGGDFRLASRPGEGTLVTAEVPLPEDDGRAT